MSFALIPAAFAAGPEVAASPSADSLQFILFLAAFALLFYFILWRPQAKRAKEHQTLISSLNVGDEVVTSGGLLGKINSQSSDFVVLSIAEGVNVVVQKSSISSTVPKGTMKSV